MSALYRIQVLAMMLPALILFLAPGSHAWVGEVSLVEEMVIERGPDGRSFQRLTSVAYDRSRNEIVIVDSGADRVYALDRRGEFTNILGRGGELREPVGVAVDGKGAIYISERNAPKIKIFEREPGRVAGTFTELVLPVDADEAVSPGKVTIGSAGTIFVVEEKNGWIFVFDSERNFLYRMGRKGKDGKAFHSLIDLACDSRGIVYSASRGLDPLNEFDKRGQFVQSVSDPRADMEEVIHPVGIAADSRNHLWVLDGTRESISIYGPASEHVQTIEEGDIPGGLFLPVDIDFDVFDNLLVLEQGAGRLRVFSQHY